VASSGLTVIPYLPLPSLPFGLRSFGILLTLSVIVNHLVLVRRAKVLGLGSAGAIEVWAIGTALAAMGGAYGAGLFASGAGSLSSAGGFVGAGLGLVGLALALRMPLLAAADAVAYAFPFGWFVARAACALAHDHPGRLSQSAFAVRFPAGARFDLGLLEWFAMPPLIALVIVVSRNTSRSGKVVGALSVSYGILRFFLDFLRAEDWPGLSDPRFSGLTAAQWVCAVGLVPLGIALLASTSK